MSLCTTRMLRSAVSLSGAGRGARTTVDTGGCSRAARIPHRTSDFQLLPPKIAAQHNLCVCQRLLFCLCSKNKPVRNLCKFVFFLFFLRANDVALFKDGPQTAPPRCTILSKGRFGEGDGLILLASWPPFLFFSRRRIPLPYALFLISAPTVRGDVFRTAPFCRVSQVGDIKFGDLKGEDSHGNKYFENKEYPYGKRCRALCSAKPPCRRTENAITVQVRTSYSVCFTNASRVACSKRYSRPCCRLNMSRRIHTKIESHVSERLRKACARSCRQAWSWSSWTCGTGMYGATYWCGVMLELGMPHRALFITPE